LHLPQVFSPSGDFRAFIPLTQCIPLGALAWMMIHRLRPLGRNTYGLLPLETSTDIIWGLTKTPRSVSTVFTNLHPTKVQRNLKRPREIMTIFMISDRTLPRKAWIYVITVLLQL